MRASGRHFIESVAAIMSILTEQVGVRAWSWARRLVTYIAECILDYREHMVNLTDAQRPVVLHALGVVAGQHAIVERRKNDPFRGQLLLEAFVAVQALLGVAWKATSELGEERDRSSDLRMVTFFGAKHTSFFLRIADEDHAAFNFQSDILLDDIGDRSCYAHQWLRLTTVYDQQPQRG